MDKLLTTEEESTPSVSSSENGSSSTRTAGTGGLAAAEEPFPVKLHRLLLEAERTDQTDVVGWNEDGTSFLIYQPKVFAETLMKQFFLQTRYKSFQRQCNLYNFIRSTQGRIKGHCKCDPHTYDMLFCCADLSLTDLAFFLFSSFTSS